MTEELLIAVSEFETRVALLADGAAQEVHIARYDKYSDTGNIYLGRVERIVPGMQAAFVDVGLERPGFLHARDIEGPRLIQAEEPPDTPDIRNLLRDGQDLMVQITKDPISGKGARLTTKLAIASRLLVLMPFNDHIGISQRIEEETERDRLRQLIDSERVAENINMGFIARTAADGAAAEPVANDIRVLTRIWDKVLANQRKCGAPAIVYQELPLHIRVVRDMAGANLARIHIDHEETHSRVQEFIVSFLPEFADIVHLYQDDRPLFDRFGIEDEIARALGKRVPLKNGGHLIIEQTEAMTTVDVNTGGFLGGHSLEETVFRTNLEAAQAIPRQLRLRNLGGIVVIDFIDMQQEDHQRQVLRVLEQAFEGDPARLHIEGFSSLGLVQLSRKRTRESLVQQICESCSHCDGTGVVKTAETACAEIFRGIVQDARTRCANGSVAGVSMGADRESAAADAEYLVRAPESVVDRLLVEDAHHLEQLTQVIGRGIRIQVEPSYGAGEFDVVLVQGMRRPQ